jgi:hypothetical protein
MGKGLRRRKQTNPPIRGHLFLEIAAQLHVRHDRSLLDFVSSSANPNLLARKQHSLASSDRWCLSIRVRTFSSDNQPMCEFVGMSFRPDEFGYSHLQTCRSVCNESIVASRRIIFVNEMQREIQAEKLPLVIRKGKTTYPVVRTDSAYFLVRSPMAPWATKQGYFQLATGGTRSSLYPRVSSPEVEMRS